LPSCGIGKGQAIVGAALEIASAFRLSPGEVDGALIPLSVVQPKSVVFPAETEAQRRRRVRRQGNGSPRLASEKYHFQVASSKA
jgi:hypothetical protein